MELLDKLKLFFDKSDSPILFAGAGVSVRANVPVWSTLLTNLAEASREYDPLTRQMMIERIHEEDYLSAATYYDICKKIPEAEKYSILRNNFEDYDSNKLECLASLPFNSIVTTNYDRALQDAYAGANGSSAINFSLGEVGLRSAAFEKGFYIARLHGRSEVPESIVLSENQYEQLSVNDAYHNLLVNIFTRKQIMFVGFSFLDPAIANILKTVNDKYGKIHNGRHIAVLPDDANTELLKELESFSIEKVFYSHESYHSELWDGIDGLCELIKQKDLEFNDLESDPFSPAKKYLASCYARIKIGPKISPLKKVVAEGVVSALMDRAGRDGVLVKEIVYSVHVELGINEDEAETFALNAIDALSKEGLCENDGIKVSWCGDDVSLFDRAVESLSGGVIARLVVREGFTASQVEKNCITSALRYLVYARGWDLGASFAANKVPDPVEFDGIFENISECASIEGEQKLDLTRALVNLISSPSEEEAKLLTELGRMAFALELILQTPHDPVFHSLTLPEKIYLDANVLMPAVTYGHPFHDVYKQTIASLIEAANNSQINLKVIAYYGFLNEVVSHKRLAVEEYDHLSHESEYLKDLVQQAELYGVNNLNVFVGGYVTLLVNKEKISFEAYLSKYAPYNNEKDLAKWLGQQGIEVIEDHGINVIDGEYAEILHSLEVSYSEGATWKPKDAVLIRHDAVQLAAVNADIKRNVRSVFVTADRRLRENINKGRFSSLSNNMISHIGLMQLIDLLVGVSLDEQSVSRMLWGTRVSSETEQIRNYLIDHALNEYDDAIAMAMHDVVDDVTSDIVQKLKEDDLSLQSGDCSEKIKITKIVGTFENIFYDRMRTLIEKD